MSSAVHNLQKAILDGQQSLTQLLRQTKVIAAKLNLEDVERWVDLELNGYPENVEVPSYRKLNADRLEIHNGYRGEWQFAGLLNIEFVAHFPIGTIMSYSQGEAIGFPVKSNFPLRDDSGDSFGSNWPQRCVVGGLKFKGVVEAVTNELLRWTTELEKRGIKGEDMNFNEKEKQLAANQVFNIETVHGTVGNIINSQVTLYDYSSVQQLLIDQKIPKHDRRELEDIMDELKEAPPEKKPSPLARAERWIVKHQELLGAGAELVAKAVGAGMKP